MWPSQNVFNSMMNYSFYQGLAPFAILLVVWELFWKGKGLWKAAQNKNLGWFIAILILNTVGILPIVYLYFFSKKHSK